MLEEKITAIWSFKKCNVKGVLVKIWTSNRHKTRIRYPIEVIFFQPDYFFDIYAKITHGHKTYSFTFIAFWPYIGQNYMEKWQSNWKRGLSLPGRSQKNKQVLKKNRIQKILEEKVTMIWSFNKCNVKGGTCENLNFKRT